MTYTEKNGEVILRMSRDDHAVLMIILVYGLAACGHRDRPLFQWWLNFVNRLNTGNPDYMPYVIPEKETP